MGKKAKKQTMSLTDFVGKQPTSNLPTAPGELASGPGRRYGKRNQYENSRSDESRQWRNNSGPPRRQGGFNNRDRDDRRGGGFGPRRDRDGDGGFGGRREREESKYGDSFSRDQFGSKKQQTPMRRSFNNDRPRTRDSPGGEDRMLDRSSMGQRQQTFMLNKPRQQRQDTFSRDNFGTRRPDGFGSSYERRNNSRPIQRRTEWDGDGTGFGADLVADLFESSFEEKQEKRVTYFDGAQTSPPKVGASRFANLDGPGPRRDQSNPWGTTKIEKTPEQLEKEEREKSERAERNRLIKAEEDAKRAKKRAAKEKKEEEARRIAEEKREKEEREAYLIELNEQVKNIMDTEPNTLNHEMLGVVRSFELTSAQATIIGKSMAMSVMGEVINLADAIRFIPDTEFDVVLLTLLSSLCLRLGESKFLQELNNEQVDPFELLVNKDDYEGQLKQYDLNCLVPKDELNNQLEEAFDRHVNLEALFEVIQSFEEKLPTDLNRKVMMYIFDEFFTQQDINNPEAFFNYVPLFHTICDTERTLIEVVDVAVASWHQHCNQGSVLVPMFDILIRNDSITYECIMQWNYQGEYNDSKNAAMMSYVDAEEEQIFSEWVMNVENEYYEEEESEEDEYNTGYV